MLEDSTQTTEPEIPAAAEPAPVPDSPTPVAATEQSEAAPDPAAEGTEAPKTILEAALHALAPKTDAAATTAAEPAGAEGAPAPAQTSAENAADQGEPLDGVPLIPDADFKALPKHVRTAVVELRKQVKTLQPDATRGQAVSSYMRDAGITPHEYADLLDVGALLKRDPAKAREVIVSKLAEIDRVLGNTLPDDLREEVESGLISEDRARELSRTKAVADRAEHDRVAAAAQAAERAVTSAVDAWEAEMRSADKGFASLLPDIMDRAELEVARRARAGKPVSTPAEAVQIARDAHKAVVDMRRRFAPAPVATPRVPSSAASAPAAPIAPTSIYQAAGRAVGIHVAR